MNFANETLTFEPLCAEHKALFLALNAHPEVMRYIADVKAPEQIEALFTERLWSNRDVSHWHNWAIKLKSTAQPIGLVGFKLQGAQAEIGYMLLPEHAGRGYMSQSLKALIQHAKQQYNIDQLKAVVTQGNEVSRHLLLANGFVQGKTTCSGYVINGQAVQDWHFTLPVTAEI